MEVQNQSTIIAEKSQNGEPSINMTFIKKPSENFRQRKNRNLYFLNKFFAKRHTGTQGPREKQIQKEFVSRDSKNRTELERLFLIETVGPFTGLDPNNQILALSYFFL